MTTNAKSSFSAALYRDDPGAASVAMSNMALTGDALFQTYQAAAGNRYWDESVAVMVQKKIHGGGSWATVTPDAINYLRGSIYFATPLNNDDTIQILSGSRRSEANFIKIMNIYKGQLKIDRKTIDITSGESAGWDEAMAGQGSFEYTSSHYFFYAHANEDAGFFAVFGVSLIAKFYSDYTGTKSWIGKGLFTQESLELMSLNNAQSKAITFSGTKDIFPET